MLPSCRTYLIGLLSLVLTGIACACSVPVFRYALERWRHNATDELFRLTIFSSGPVSNEMSALLGDVDAPNGPRPNVVINWVDTAQPMIPADQRLWKEQKSATLPWMVLRTPEIHAQQHTLHSGPLNGEVLRPWIDSPVRRSLIEKLRSGSSVVWVLVESGDPERDELVSQRIQNELTRLEKEVKLPEPDDDQESVLQSAIPLKIAFPLIRVARNATGEQEFLHQLMTLDEDYSEDRGPLLFPIFGRGRMLTGLREKEMTPRLLEEVCRYLCAACSCRVKAQNPGVDLLWLADWDSFLDENVMPIPAPPTTRIPEPIPIRPTPLPTAELPSGSTAPASFKTVFQVGIGLALALVLLTGWWVVRSWRTP